MTGRVVAPVPSTKIDRFEAERACETGGQTQRRMVSPTSVDVMTRSRRRRHRRARIFWWEAAGVQAASSAAGGECHASLVVSVE